MSGTGWCDPRPREGPAPPADFRGGGIVPNPGPVTVPVVFGFDDSFLVPAGVCIRSLLEHARETTSYEIHLIARGIGEEERERFLRMVGSFRGGHRIEFHDPGSAYEDGRTTQDFTTAMYYRFLIPRLFGGYGKVIYSDVDVVFREDLSHLLEIDLEGCLLAAVSARFVVHLIETPLRRSNLQHLSDRYFASGLLVMNIPEMRRDRTVERIDRLLRERRYEFPDNDALNEACAGRVKYLPLRYCVPPFVGGLLELEINRTDPERERMIRESIERPAIIHYLGPDKPWKGHVTSVYERYWWEYYGRSPWYSWWFHLKNGLLRRTRFRLRAARKRAKQRIRERLAGPARGPL